MREDPTFFEFIDFVLDTRPENLDAHWKPIWMVCAVCQLPFDYVIKFENFQTEFNILVNHYKNVSNLPSEFEVLWQNKEVENYDDKHTLTVKYIKSLPIEKRKRIYQVYQNDFILFNFSSREYFD